MDFTKLTDLSKEVHLGNKERGFYDKPKEIGTQLMLVVSELGEAIEADRNGLIANKVLFQNMLTDGYGFKESFKTSIKDSYEDEIADAIIRLLDHCGYKGIDIGFHIEKKLKYNSTREPRHGKAY